MYSPFRSFPDTKPFCYPLGYPTTRLWLVPYLVAVGKGSLGVSGLAKFMAGTLPHTYIIEKPA